MIGDLDLWKGLKTFLGITKSKKERVLERRTMETQIMSVKTELHNELAVPIINKSGQVTSASVVYNEWKPFNDEHPEFGIHYLAHQSKYLTLIRFVAEKDSYISDHLYEDNVKYEILILNEGLIEHGENGNTKTIKPGDYHILQANSLHSYKALKKSHGYIFWVPGFKDKFGGRRQSVLGI